MVVTIHQPQYLPYIGTVAKIISSNIFVSYDTANYQKNYFNNRNRVMTHSGQVWLTIPVHAKFGQQIKDVTIDGNQWKQKHIRTIKQLYSKSKYFDNLFSGFESAIQISSNWLIDYTDTTLEWILSALQSTVIKLSSSEMEIKETSAQKKLVEMTKKSGGSVYLAGPSWNSYMSDITDFKTEGIRFLECEVHQINYKSIAVYAENMSIIDLLFSCNTADAINIVKQCITTRELD